MNSKYGNDENRNGNDGTRNVGSVERPNGIRRGISNGAGEESEARTKEISNASNLESEATWLRTTRHLDLSASTRHRQNELSEKIIEHAKQVGLYIPRGQEAIFGKKVQGQYGESVVYIDKDSGVVIKIKDPFAKSAIKGDEPLLILEEVRNKSVYLK